MVNVADFEQMLATPSATTSNWVPTKCEKKSGTVTETFADPPDASAAVVAIVGCALIVISILTRIETAPSHKHALTDRRRLPV